MHTERIERQFARIGARAKIHPPALGRWGRPPLRNVSIDIRSDERGEFFDISLAPDVAASTLVVDSQPALRHLLLMSPQADEKHKFLCGHDERHWFVAAVPEKAAVASVQGAFDALKPATVHAIEERLGVKARHRNRRRNAAFVRQGEWFFTPIESGAEVNERVILRHEPISRGRGKPHICDEVVRYGGELVYVHAHTQQVITQSQYQQLLHRSSGTQPHWRLQRRNPTVYVRGHVRHPDHKTIFLDGWHEVMMNTENQSLAMQHVAFLD